MIGVSFYNAYWFDNEMLKLWGDEVTLTHWLEVEVALARAEADLGIIPATAAERIAEVAVLENFDLAEMGRQIAIAQHPLVPVLRHLEELAGEDAGGWIHWGATTQNIFDTGQAMQMQRTVAVMIGRLDDINAKLAAQAQTHARTLQAGRTHGQHALPISFGYKVAGWLAELRRHRHRLSTLGAEAFVARLGGAAGTYAALDGRGREVEASIARLLNLSAPDLGGRADFDRQAAIMMTMSGCVAACERIASDISFMQRTEVAELAENHYASRVGSSTMAQKRNPSESQRIIAMSRLVRSRVPLALEAMVRQDEGDAASTNVTDLLIPDFFVLAGSVLSAFGTLLDGIHVDAVKMRSNLDLTGGQISAEAVMMALGEVLGRGHAHHILHQAAATALETGMSFSEAILNHPELASLNEPLDLDAMLDPANYLGEVEAIIAQLVDERITD
jgi:3-carboxy-cis,cis-muconate cycloisomerase